MAYIGNDVDAIFIPGSVNTSTNLTITGGGLTQTGGDVNFDSGTLFIDEDAGNIGIGTTSPNIVGVNNNSKILSIVGNGTTTTARGALELCNPRADAAGNTLGTLYFAGSSANYAEIRAVSSGSGGESGFGNELRFSTKADNGSNSMKMVITAAGNVGIGTTNPAVALHVASGPAYFANAEPVYGGFGARSTVGTENWNHSTNARSGGGWSLLLGTHTNGPGPSSYFHPFSFEYGSKDGGGNMTQFAIGYNDMRVFMRYRYDNVWSSWIQL